jgi:hypothetical protein
MRVLGAIIRVSALSVLHAGKQLTLSGAIAPQLVSHDHPRHILQTLQQPSEEALCGVGIAPGLNEDVEDNTILIDGAPEIMLHALNPDDDFVDVPFVAWSRPAASQAIGEIRGKFLTPAGHRLVGDDNATLSQEQLNISQAEAEHVVQPHGVADDLGGEPMAIAGIGSRLHATSFTHFQAAYQIQLP